MTGFISGVAHCVLNLPADDEVIVRATILRFPTDRGYQWLTAKTLTLSHLIFSVAVSLD